MSRTVEEVDRENLVLAAQVARMRLALREAYRVLPDVPAPETTRAVKRALESSDPTAAESLVAAAIEISDSAVRIWETDYEMSESDTLVLIDRYKTAKAAYENGRSYV